MSTGHRPGSVGYVTMNAVEMKFGRAPHGLEILRQAAGFENRAGPGGFVKAPLHIPVHWVCYKIYFSASPRMFWCGTRTHAYNFTSFGSILLPSVLYWHPHISSTHSTIFSNCPVIIRWHKYSIKNQTYCLLYVHPAWSIICWLRIITHFQNIPSPISN